MKKKTFIIAVCIAAVLTIVGIILINTYSTPYRINSSWLEEGRAEYYFYAKANIGKYAALYFSGIALTIIGPVGAAIVIIKKMLAKKQKPISNDVTSNLD